MKIKEYISGLHKSIAADHRDMASTHEACARATSKLMECLMGMAKANKPDDKIFAKAVDALGELKFAHDAGATNHYQKSFDHDKDAEACAKAAEADLAKLQPDRISSVFTQDTPDAGFGLRAIPRQGSPAAPEPVSKAAVESINPVFRHLVSPMTEEQ